MAVFYSPDNQMLFDTVAWLPQLGANAGPTGRPPNSYAVIDGEDCILIDAAFSWTMTGIHALNEAGHRPTALVLTHSDVVDQSDAIGDIYRTYRCDVLLHQADRTQKVLTKLGGVPVGDPEGHRALTKANLDVIPLPFHTPGSIMLHTGAHEGVLFSGDSAVAPGPLQRPEPARLERPMVGEDRDADFVKEWQVLCATRFFSSVLPLHGTPYVERGDMREIHATLFQGSPMNPAQATSGEPRMEAFGVPDR